MKLIREEFKVKNLIVPLIPLIVTINPINEGLEFDMSFSLC
ncbi:hypothetical protein [Saccharolobus islandicus]|nr:hypothetical protein [Sulfolobus islandicus]